MYFNTLRLKLRLVHAHREATVVKQVHHSNLCFFRY